MTLPPLPSSFPPLLQAFDQGILPFPSSFPRTHHPEQQQEPAGRQPFLLPFLPRPRHAAERQSEEDSDDDDDDDE